jgi:hypothetical protein
MRAAKSAFSAEALADLRAVRRACDFTFVIGIPFSLRCCRLSVAFTDFTLLMLRSTRWQLQSTIQMKVVSQIQGSSVAIRQEDAERFVLFCGELSEWELARLIDRRLKSPLTMGKVIDLLLLLWQTSSDFWFEVNLGSKGSESAAMVAINSPTWPLLPTKWVAFLHSLPFLKSGGSNLALHDLRLCESSTRECVGPFLRDLKEFLTIQKPLHRGRVHRILLTDATGLRFSFLLTLFYKNWKRIWHREVPALSEQ